jgi:LysM repeat protein
MSNKRRSMLIISIFAISIMLISACTQSLSSAPANTPTVVPTGLFVSPIPSVQNPMAMIEEFAKQTAAAQTTVAGGGAPGTPQAVTTGAAVTPNGTVTTPVPVTPTNAAATTAASGGTPAPIGTAVPPGVRPQTYTLQTGEFAYCIARRFNVDPSQILCDGSPCSNLELPGAVLKIPQSGAFPGSRALAAHPATYTVISSDETLYSIACKYGDVDPGAIASANGISASAKLTVGQQIKIP